MPNVLLRDVPDDVHAALQRLAQDRGQSLQQHLAAELARLAVQPSVEDLFRRIEGLTGGRVGFRAAVEDRDADRSER